MHRLWKPAGRSNVTALPLQPLPVDSSVSGIWHSCHAKRSGAKGMITNARWGVESSLPRSIMHLRREGDRAHFVDRSQLPSSERSWLTSCWRFHTASCWSCSTDGDGVGAQAVGRVVHGASR